MNKTKIFLKDLLYILLGTAIYGVGICVFTAPNDIAPGGVTGIATILNDWLSLPIGLGMFLLNLPLFVIAILKFNKRFVLKTFIAMFAMSFFCDFFAFLPPYKDDLLTASIFGGVLSGLGLAIVFMRGFVTGGTDLLGKIIRLKFPHISLGTMLMTIDFSVVAAAGIYYGNIRNTLYPLICIFISSIVINRILDGMDIARVAMIITSVPEEISRYVIEELDRTTTIFEGRGGYKNNEVQMVMCTVRIRQLPKLKKAVKSIDPKAFMMINTASEVLGEGFKDYDNDIN